MYSIERGEHFKRKNLLQQLGDIALKKVCRKSSYSVKSSVSEEEQESKPDALPEIQNGEANGAKQCRPEPENQSPLWICSFMTRRPKTVFAFLLLVHLSLLVATGVMMVAGYDILPVDFKGVPLDLEKEDVFLRALAWQNRETDDILPTSQTTNDVESESLMLFYESDNVFTADNLRVIQAFEDELTNVADYTTFCFRTDGITCPKPFSILRLFDGTFGPFFNDSSFGNIPQTLENAMNQPEIARQVNFFLGKNSFVSAADGVAKSSITRTVFYFNYYTELENFMVNNYRQKLLNLNENGLGSMKFLYSCQTLFIHDVQRQVVFDMMLAVGSFGFILIFMLFQTHSLFVTFFAIFSILTSFIGANMIYRIVFDYKYFGIFHVLSIFIILGIGADDVFVYFDTWRATSHDQIESLEQRLSKCYRRASKSMLITSLTTMVAFISNAFSPVLGISSFGLFSATLVLINYLSVITFFPSVVLIYHLYFEKWTWPCCRPCRKRSHTVPSRTISVTDVSENHTARKNIVVRFFYGYYFRFVTHQIIRWVIIAGFLAIIVVFIVFMKDLKPDEESTKIFKDDHNYQMANDRQKNAFRPSGRDRIIRVYMVWGLRLQDRSACHKTDWEKCTGKTVWDEAFDLNPSPAQLQLQTLCHDMQNLPDKTNADLHIRKNSVTGKLEVDCFLDDMETFLVNESAKAVLYGVSADFSIPLTETKVSHLMTSHPELYNGSAISPNVYRYFETAAAFWLNGGYTSNVSSDYSHLLGFSKDQYDTLPLLNNTRESYGTRLRYIAITANTSLVRGKLGYEMGIPIYDAWERFFKAKLARLPPSLSGGFQCTPEGNNVWHWLKVQKTLVDSALRGIAIGICLAFVVLTIATQNVIIGFLATLTIACVTVTIIAIIPMVGWKLGVLESLNLSLVVGLSVDYVVHLAEGYHMSIHADRKSKVRDMLETVAVSISSGAASTLGASIFMLFAEILFFVQFGIFMFCTIGFSLIYSLGLFTTILAVMGPEGNVGSLVPLWRKLRYFVQGRKSTDTTCETCRGKGFCSTNDIQTNENQVNETDARTSGVVNNAFLKE